MALLKIFLKDFKEQRKNFIILLTSGILLIAAINFFPPSVEILFKNYGVYGVFSEAYFSYISINKVIIFIIGLFFIYVYINYYLKNTKKFAMYMLLGIKKSSLFLFIISEGIFVFIFSTVIGTLLGRGLLKIFSVFISNILKNELQNIWIDPSLIIKSYQKFLAIIFILVVLMVKTIDKKDLNDLFFRADEVSTKIKHEKTLKILGGIIALSGFVLGFSNMFMEKLRSGLLMSISMFLLIIGIGILLNIFIFSDGKNNSEKGEQFLQNILIKSNINTSRLKSVLVITVSFLSSFAITFMMIFYLNSYIENTSKGALDKPYTYDAVIISKEKDLIENLDITKKNSDKNVEFSTYKVYPYKENAMDLADTLVISQSKYNEVTDDDLNLEKLEAKIIDTNYNDDKVRTFDESSNVFTILEQSKNRNIKLKITSVDGKYVFKGLLEWKYWIVLPDEIFYQLAPSDEYISNVNLIRYKDKNSEYFLKKTLEDEDVLKDNMQVYYKSTIVNLLKQDQKIMTISAVLIAIIIQLFFIYYIYIKISSEIENTSRKYKLCTYMGMDKKNIERIFKAEIRKIYSIPAYVGVFTVLLFLFSALFSWRENISVPLLTLFREVLLNLIIVILIVIILFYIIHFLSRYYIYKTNISKIIKDLDTDFE